MTGARQDADWRESEAGQALVFLAIVFMMLLLFAGLAVDTGQLYVARRTMQEAADAAAFAGAAVIYQGGTHAPGLPAPNQATNAALDDAARNGYANGVNGVSITVNNPPASGTYAGNGNFVEVIMTTSVRTSLVPAEGGLTTVTVRGVAGSQSANNTYALLVLDEGNVSGAITVAAGAVIDFSSANIGINSSSATAGINNGVVQDCASLNPCTPSVNEHTDVVGAATPAVAWPGLRTGRPIMPDPYAGYPKPSVAGQTSYSSVPAAPATLSPGIYETTASIAASSSTYTLNSGVYILRGSSINITGSASLTGTGVIFFVTNSNYPNAGGTCGAITFNTNQGSSLSPPTTGTYRGMLVYQDPVCTNPMTVQGNAEIETETGTIYLPSATFVMSGAGTQVNASQIVANRVQVNGGQLEISFDALITAAPVIPGLAE